MGGNALKGGVNWKAAARNALREEGDQWDDWRVRSAMKRMVAFMTHESLARRGYPRSEVLLERQYYRRYYPPDFGPSKVLLGITGKTPQSTVFESTSS